MRCAAHEDTSSATTHTQTHRHTHAHTHTRTHRWTTPWQGHPSRYTRLPGLAHRGLSPSISRSVPRSRSRSLSLALSFFRSLALFDERVLARACMHASRTTIHSYTRWCGAGESVLRGLHSTSVCTQRTRVHMTHTHWWGTGESRAARFRASAAAGCGPASPRWASCCH